MAIILTSFLPTCIMVVSFVKVSDIDVIATSCMEREACDLKCVRA